MNALSTLRIANPRPVIDALTADELEVFEAGDASFGVPLVRFEDITVATCAQAGEDTVVPVWLNVFLGGLCDSVLHLYLRVEPEIIEVWDGIPGYHAQSEKLASFEVTNLAEIPPFIKEYLCRT